jgi:hypothetical protein
MKFLLLLIVVIVAFAAGYLSEPKLRMQLTGKSANLEEAAPNPKPVQDDEVPFEPVSSPEDTPMVISKLPVDETTPEVVPVVPVVPLVTPTDPVLPIVPDVPVTEVPEPVAGAADVVSLMKASIAARQVSKFTADQILEWEAGTSPETIDGVSYQVGSLIYQAETPFGIKNLPAKALIKDGKVVRWISPKSGMQIE